MSTDGPFQSMPTALPVTAVTMNYSSVVLVGFGCIAAVWYAVHSRKGTPQMHPIAIDVKLTVLQRIRVHLQVKACKTLNLAKDRTTECMP